MTLNDSLSNVLSKINTYEKLGKKEVMTKNNSKLIRATLDVMQKHGYIGEYKELEDGKGKIIHLNLLNHINKCGVIKPRFKVTKKQYDEFEKRYLPAIGFGILIISTSKGILTNEEAKKIGIGGKLIAYCY